MGNINNSQLLYKQALRDPSKLTEDDILGLLMTYPYSQPLVFSYEKRKSLLGEDGSHKGMALLYASSSNWLWSFVNKSLPISPAVDMKENDVDSFSDEVHGEEGENEANNEAELVVKHEEPDEIAAVEEAILEEEVEQDDELEKLAYEGGVMADYFIFEEKENTEEISQEISVPQEPEKADVSLYNDDLMPYSFRWWLHKTRLEHADNYQPFAVPILVKKVDNQTMFRRVDENILDQQIKENIINFQDPEMKLSEEVKQKPVVPTQPKRSDEIIARFIKEEPIIQAPSAENLNNENMARQSAEDNYVFVTETLANIYVDQGLYLKAIEVFRKLILKYPEKKSYFASRIQELEENI